MNNPEVYDANKPTMGERVDSFIDNCRKKKNRNNSIKAAIELKEAGFSTDEICRIIETTK